MSVTPPLLAIHAIDELQASPLATLFEDDPAFLLDLLNTFCQTANQRLVALRTALSSDDVETLRRLVHELRGMCLSVGCAQLPEALEQLENHLMQGAPAAVYRPQCQEVISQLAAVVQQLQSLLS
jgi:HPt (histidine-containing phosphotransfer) domain-containing protein